MALAFRTKSLNPFNVFSLCWEVGDKRLPAAWPIHTLGYDHFFKNQLASHNSTSGQTWEVLSLDDDGSTSVQGDHRGTSLIRSNLPP